MTILDDKTGGYSQYVGKKTAETYTRVYDKRIEHQADFSWIRVETVYQGDRARPALKAYCEGASVGALVKRHVDFPAWEDWQRIVGGHAAKFQVKTSDTDTRRWLLETVTKSIAKELVQDESHEFWFRMLERIRCEISLLEIECPIIDF